MNKFMAASALFGGISRRMFFWRGIFVLLTGVLIALNPVISLELAAKILGVFFALFGGWTVLSGAAGTGRRLFWVAFGLAVVVWGLFMVFQPFKVVFLVAWLIALWLIVGGIAGLWSAAMLPVPANFKILPVISGFIGLFIGVVLFIWPLTSMAGMLWIAGLLLVIRGAMLIAFSRILPEPPEEGKQD